MKANSQHLKLTCLVPIKYHLVRAAAFAIGMLTLSCAEPTGPTTGGLDVAIETIGSALDADADGYSLVIDSGQYSFTAPVSVSTHLDLPIGTHLIRLKGLAPNCSITGPTEQSVNVVGGSTVAANFTVTCIAFQTGQSIAYVIQTSTGEEIHLVNSDGTNARNLSTRGNRDVDPAWSPDGTRIAFASKRDGSWTIYVMNADGTDPVRLTTFSGSDPKDRAPAWSPDGKRIAFARNPDSRHRDVYVINADGTNQTRMTNTGGSDYPDWSPDGSQIVFSSGGVAVPGLWLMNSDGSNQHQITFNGHGDYSPAWSPDGKRIAYTSASYYTTDIFVVNPDGSGITQVTHNLPYVDDPAWSPDGTRIAFGSVSDGSCVTVFSDYQKCDSYVGIIGLDGRLVLSFAPGSNPAWRR